MLAEIFVNKR